MDNALTSAILDAILIGEKVEFYTEYGQMTITIKDQASDKELNRQTLPIDCRHGMNDKRVCECIKWMNTEIAKRKLDNKEDGYVAHMPNLVGIQVEERMDQIGGWGGC
jgi:hypothetical protein